MKSPTPSLAWSCEDQAAAEGWSCVAGVDEAGRGPLAGPVIAAAVIWQTREIPQGINDSKKLSPAKREAIAAQLTSFSGLIWALGEASPQEIDQINILQATRLAMERALGALSARPDFALLDGCPFPSFAWRHRGIVSGDAISPSIASASILAKVARDRQMVALDAVYPGYGFAEHKGYGTARHLDALQKLGPCPAHRRSFAPVSQASFDFGES